MSMNASISGHQRSTVTASCHTSGMSESASSLRTPTAPSRPGCPSGFKINSWPRCPGWSVNTERHCRACGFRPIGRELILDKWVADQARPRPA